MHIQDDLEEFPGKSFHVEAYKIGASSRDNTVDEEINKFQGTCGSTNIDGVANVVATNSDVDVIGILFLWTEFANHSGVCELLSLVNRDVIVANINKCVTY